jgi:hypothetical protein
MEDFEKIIKDFTKDLLVSFPELKQDLHKDIETVCLDKEDKKDALARLYEHTNLIFPQRFFDILYENQDMFSNEENNLEFLPGIDFKLLWKEELSDNTRECIWKYLQLLLFTVAGKLSSNESFGDTAKLFEAIDEDELKNKLQETMDSLQDMFKDVANNQSNSEGDAENSGDAEDSGDAEESGGDSKPSFTMPDPQNIHAHIQDMFDGKIGNLAKEIADETMKDMNIDSNNVESAPDLFKNLLKDPKKLMGLVQSVGKKLDEKLKSGEVKETELLKEASDMLKKMKEMPGMNHMESMFKKMGIPMPNGANAGGGKMNFGAMEGRLQQQMRQAKMKERMRERLNKQPKASTGPPPSVSQADIDREVEKLMTNVFSTGETVERSVRPKKSADGDNSKPKKKKKKKKNK